jgi:hypothetical protein
VANLVAVGAIAVVQSEGLTSVWCIWAAVVSVLIYVQFTWWRNADAADVAADALVSAAGR